MLAAHTQVIKFKDERTFLGKACNVRGNYLTINNQLISLVFVCIIVLCGSQLCFMCIYIRDTTPQCICDLVYHFFYEYITSMNENPVITSNAACTTNIYMIFVCDIQYVATR